MASTPNKKQATSLGKSDSSRSPNRSPQASNSSKSSKPKSSMGLDLLLIAIGTSLIGLGVLGYLFYQELLGSSKREIDRSAESQSRQIESNLANVRQSVDGVASAARTLSQQPPKPKTVELYQKLLIEGLQKSELVSGMGIAQNENTLFTAAKPLVPYVWKEQSGLKLEAAGQKLTAPNDKLLSGNRLDIPNSPFYKVTIKGKESWSEPYNSLGKPVITYSAPINDGQKVLGVVNGDAIASNLLPIASSSSENKSESKSKIGFVIVSASGKVITASDQFQATQAQNPAVIEALNNLSEQAKAQLTGIAQTGGNIWAYRKIEGSNLLVVAYLPEAEIINKLLVLVGGAAIGISAILAIAVLGFVNSLKKRLKPLTEECDRFLTQQGNSGIDVAGKDEIERLSLSLKNTFQQVKTNEIRLRSASTPPTSLDPISTEQMQRSFADTELMEAEVGDLLDVVSSMEEGDLTIEAQVNDRATGLVADTLNRLREKLVEIISSVLGTAKQVAKGASDLEELTRTVVLNTAEQAQSVTQGQSLTEQVAAIASRSADQVNVANQSLQEVRDTVASGQTAINTLTESISVLQTGSAQIVQRMKTLGEFVGLAEQFVQDQGQIASLTQVLALNATLVAARAAEQKDPKQFTGVAREFESIAGQVNDLATQTNDGLTVLQQRTSQIQTVVTAIDIEVQNLSGLVSGFTTGVEDSQSAFNSIQTATEEVVQIGQTITKSSTEIAEAAGSTASYISEIAQLADRTANLTRSARQQAEAMGNQAQQLLQGIQFFRLPDTALASVSTNISPNISTNTSTTSSSVDSSTPSTLVNSLFDVPVGSKNTDDSGGLSRVVPAIALATAASTAVVLGISQTAQSDATAYTEPDLNFLDDNEYLIEKSLSNEFDEFNASTEDAQTSFDLEFDPVFDLPPESAFVDAPEVDAPESFISDIEPINPFLDIAENQDQAPDQTLEDPFSELTDISVIEESLLADLRQEIYEESSIDDDNADPMEDMQGVDEFAIVEASSDPMIVSATSSFLEDTVFGNPAPLLEDNLTNLPTSLDFTIPDLDSNADFEMSNVTIESTLDDSNSFFDATSVQQLDIEIEESDMDFDPFYTELTALESSDYIIEDNVFESAFLAPDVSDNLADEFTGEFTNDFSVKVFDDDSDSGSSITSSSITNDALDELLEESLEKLSNEALSDQFDMSFEELPFDSTVDQALQLESQDNLVELSTQEGNVYFDDLLNDSLPAEFDSELDESLLISSSDLDASDYFFDCNPMQDSSAISESPMLELADEQSKTAFPSLFDGDFEDEFEDGLDDLNELDFSSNFPSSLLEVEELPVDSIDEIFSDSNISSIFNVNSSKDDDLEMDGSILGANTFSAADTFSEVDAFAEDDAFIAVNALNKDDAFAEDMELDIEFIDISGIVESETSNPLPEVPSDVLTSEISEVDNLGLASEFTESIPDLSLDFSDEWLGDIEVEDDNSDRFGDFSIEYPSIDVSSSDMSPVSNYGFADNLLDSLMEESDEELEDIPEDEFMGLLLLSDSHSLSTIAPEVVKAEDADSESQFDFDFSAFDDLNDDLNESGKEMDATRAKIDTARAEIDDFLSGALGMEDVIEAKNSKSLKTNKNPHGEISPSK
jgi:twitching motility protein PilJ